MPYILQVLPKAATTPALNIQTSIIPWFYQTFPSSTPASWVSNVGQIFVPVGTGGGYLYDNGAIIPVGMLYKPATLMFPELLLRPAPLARPAIVRKRLLAGRKALRRSVDLFRMLRPESEIRTFLSGKPLVIEGCRFDYRVRKRENVLKHTMEPTSRHIPYDLHLLDKQSRNDLSKGCIIVPQTPVIDQLLALILHVQDPVEEVTVIKTANWQPKLPRRVYDELRMAA